MDFQNAFSRAASGKHGKILVLREAESNSIKQVMVQCPPSGLELISKNYRALRRALDFDLTEHLCTVAKTCSMICSELCISSEFGALSLRELDYDPTNNTTKEDNMAYDPDDDEGAPFGEPDREADTDNGHLYGYTDEEDGRTQWYDSQGNCDCETRW